MHKVKRVKAQEIIPFIDEILESGQSACITVTGSSMYPFLRNGSDRVELCRRHYDSVKSGDIALVKDGEDQYILHRVLRINPECFYTAGDAQQSLEGPFTPCQLLAVVNKVYRGNRPIFCTSASWKLYSRLWMSLFPMRHILIKSYLVIDKVINLKFNK